MAGGLSRVRLFCVCVSKGLMCVGVRLVCLSLPSSWLAEECQWWLSAEWVACCPVELLRCGSVGGGARARARDVSYEWKEGQWKEGGTWVQRRC